MNSDSTSPILTLDSLYKFKHEKVVSKFSHQKKANDDSGSNTSDNDSLSIKRKVVKKRRISSSDEGDKVAAKQANKIKSNQEEIDRLEKLNFGQKLEGLYTMFPQTSKLKVKTILKTSRFSVKEAIECLLKDATNDDLSVSSFTDFDEEENSKDSKTSSKSTSTASSTNSKKRSLEFDDENKDNDNASSKKKKKMKYAFYDDDDDDDDNEASNQSKPAKKAKQQSSKAKKSRFSEDDDDGNSNDIDYKNYKKKTKSDKKKKSSTNHDDGDQDHGDDDYFENDFDSDSSSRDSIKPLTESDYALRDLIFSLYNTFPIEELLTLIDTLPKRLHTVVAMRPFKDYEDLETRFNQKSLGQLLDAARGILHARNVVNQLLKKCQDISNKLSETLANLIDSKSDQVDLETTLLKITKQPALLNPKLSLKPYQLIGLNWLSIMFKENLNCILADEMGLGKTIQTIAFLAYLMNNGMKGIHLIVVPPSTLDNWIREIELWCPTINYTVYSGSLEERRFLRYDILEGAFEKPLNVILATYSIISSTNDDKTFFKKLKFDYCIFDEAHMLKNMKSMRYQSLMQIQSKRKLLLTGTPLQNNLVELMSLLNFLMPDIFRHKNHYINKLFSTKQATGESGTFFNDKINQAKGIMKPFILRRIKTDVLKQLPNKHINIIYCDMSEKQLEEYNKLVSNILQRKEEIFEAKTKQLVEVKNGLQNGLTVITKEEKTNNSFGHILMELRKAANHPLLRRCLYDDSRVVKMANLIMTEQSEDTVLQYVIDDMNVLSDFEIHNTCNFYQTLRNERLGMEEILNSGKFKVLDGLLQEKKAKSEKCLIFSQFCILLDILEEFVKIKGYTYCRLDGSTDVNVRQQMIDVYNNSTCDQMFLFLLSTKAGGMGINLTSANNVIMHDIDYNPYNDKQAEDRCHRVGQTKEVHVYKLISKGSIDETMLKIQEHKLQIGENLINDTNETNESQSKIDMAKWLKDTLKLNQ